tara:strand:+ start:6503 stop:6973 length:471 start_codon:yes stop_codon:yes gene_type:complete
MFSLATNLVLSLVVGITSALAATFFAFRKFRAERVWELRAEAYRQLINSLHDMLRVRDWKNEFAENGGKLDQRPESIVELWAGSRVAKQHILRTGDQAAFLLSKDVGKAIEQFKKSLDDALQANQAIDMFNEEAVAISACLQEVKAIGKRELGLKS